MLKLAEEEQQVKQKTVLPIKKSDFKIGEKEQREWLPYDGNLEPATTSEKVRQYKDADGVVRVLKETVFVRPGKKKYSVESGDLLAWYKARGGTRRRLVKTFKSWFPDTQEGQLARRRQQAFRAMLRSKGIPGA